MLYVKWQPEYGSEEKTRQALNTSNSGCDMQPPKPLSLDEVEGANLLKVLQQRELQIGKHAISLRLDREQRARLAVADAQGQRHEFTLLRTSSMAKMVDDTLRDPDGSGFGFVIEKKGDKHVLRASAAGFVANVDVDDLDEGVRGLLEKKGVFSRTTLEPGRAAPGMYLSFPFRSKKPWTLHDEHGEESIQFENALPESDDKSQVFAKTP